MDQVWRMSFPWWHFVLRAAVVYIAILFLLRIGGKREIGQMGAGEFVAILLISNAVQNSMNGGDNSITGGMIISSIIIVLSVLIAYLTYKSRKWERVIQGTPALLIHQGRILHKNLAKELLNTRELKMLLRRQGIHDLREIEEAVLESSGFISVTRKSDVAQNNNADSRGEMA